MIEYVVFAAACAFIGLLGWWSWDEISLSGANVAEEVEADV